MVDDNNGGAVSGGDVFDSLHNLGHVSGTILVEATRHLVQRIEDYQFWAELDVIKVLLERCSEIFAGDREPSGVHDAQMLVFQIPDSACACNPCETLLKVVGQYLEINVKALASLTWAVEPRNARGDA